MIKSMVKRQQQSTRNHASKVVNGLLIAVFLMINNNHNIDTAHAFSVVNHKYRQPSSCRKPTTALRFGIYDGDSLSMSNDAWVLEDDDDQVDYEYYDNNDEVNDNDHQQDEHSRDDQTYGTATSVATMEPDINDVNNNNNQEDEEDDEIVRFVEMMKQTPAGTLDEDTTLLLRETMEELIAVVACEHDKQDAVSTLQLATDLWRRFVQEYQQQAVVQQAAASNANAAPIPPTTDDFDRLYAAWRTALYCQNDTNNDTNDGGKTIDTHLLPTVTQAVQDLFEQVQNEVTDVAPPTTRTYEIILDVLSQSRFAARPLWHIYSAMDDERVHKSPAIYHAVISSNARSRHAHAASRAEALLKEAHEAFTSSSSSSLSNDGKTKKTKNSSQHLSVETCNRVLTAWAKSGQRYGPERAEKLIVWMETEANISPNVGSFTCLMDAYAQQTGWEAASRCEGILQRFVQLYTEERDPTLEPTVATWTIPMQAWTRLAKRKFTKASARAARLFEQWEEMYQQGKVSQGPDSLAYGMIISAFVKTSAAEAEAWLDRQYQASQDNKDDTLKPNARSVRNVVEAWTREQDDPNAMEEAEFVWERYAQVVDADEEIVADVYRTLLFGYCQRRETTRALELLQEMVNRGLHPDCFSYDRVIEANTQSEDGSIDLAYAVFSLMEEERQAGHVKPNERVYTSFIRALTKAKVPNLARKASLLLQRMQELEKSDNNPGIRPTVFTYNAVLLAAAETKNISSNNNQDDWNRALSIAVQTFNQLRQSLELDHVSIGNMLRCANLLDKTKNDPKRPALIQSTFRLACRLVLVNAFVVRDLRLVANADLCQELLGFELHEDMENDVIVSEYLPPEWTHKAAAASKKRQAAATNNNNNSAAFV